MRALGGMVRWMAGRAESGKGMHAARVDVVSFINHSTSSSSLRQALIPSTGLHIMNGQSEQMNEMKGSTNEKDFRMKESAKIYE